MSAIPTYVQKPVIGQVQIATANPNRDGSGTLGTLLAMAADSPGVAAGVRVDRIPVKATGTTTAGMIRLYYSPDGGTTKRLLSELLVPAITVSATVAAFEGAFTLPANGKFMPPNSQLLVSTEKAEVFNVFAEGGTL